MKLYSKISALGAVLVMATAFATADTIQLGSYATGAPSMGNANTAMSYGGNSTFTLNPGSVWAPALPNSTWVGFAANAGPGGTNPAWGFYTFTTTFAATGTYNGILSILADDTAEVLLNGSVLLNFGALGTNLHCADSVPNCSTVDTVSLSGLKLSGNNTLTIVLQQAGDETWSDPSGFDFDAKLTAVPEPSSLMLLGTGLIGSAGALVRRMRRA